MKNNVFFFLKDFIKQRRPHCIVIGVADRAAMHIKRDIETVVKELMDEEQFPNIKVTLMNDNLAKVYSNSKRAEQDFREFPSVLRQAVSLARRMQDPLTEFCQLTGKVFYTINTASPISNFSFS